MADPADLYREAMQALRDDDPQRACDLLLAMVAIAPEHEKAWLWLGDLLDDRREQMTALQNALLLNPNLAQARQRLNQLQQEQQVDWEMRYETAVAAAKHRQFDTARDILLALVDDNPHHLEAWLLLADLIPTIEDKIVALQNVLDLQPNHQAAQQQLALWQQHQDNPLALASRHQRNGNHQGARMAYMEAYRQAETAQARAVVQRKLVELERQSAYGRSLMQPTPTVLRLAAGPTSFYLLLIFIQMGLGWNRFFWLYLLGALLVAAGSALVMALQNVPDHPLLVQFWGEPEERPFAAHALLWAAGLAALLLPFALLLLRAASQVANQIITLPDFPR